MQNNEHKSIVACMLSDWGIVATILKQPGGEHWITVKILTLLQEGKLATKGSSPLHAVGEIDTR